MKKARKKGEQKLALSFFFGARKNGDCSRKFRTLGGSEKERKGDATATQSRAMSVSARARGQLELSHAHSA